MRLIISLLFCAVLSAQMIPNSNGAIQAVNNIVNVTTTAFKNVSGAYMAGSGYNATNRSSMGYTVTGGAVGDRVAQTFTFVNAGSGDYHLSSTDAGARDYGMTNPGSGAFSTDIDGETRTGSWDIGFDEYIAAVTGRPFLIIVTDQ